MMSPEKHEFFESLRPVRVTYDDVKTLPGPTDPPAPDMHWSEFFDQPPIIPDISSQFSRNIDVSVPIVGSPMDTVTESKMAIALAKLGGIGVIHPNLTIDEQKEEARRVKLHLNGLIEKPRTVDETESIESVLNRCEDKGFDFRTFPVVDSEGRLTGLLTQNDFDFAEDISADVATVMTPLEQILKADQGTPIGDAYTLMTQSKKKTLPLIDDMGRVTGLYIYSDVKRIVNDKSGSYTVDENGRLRSVVAVPTKKDTKERIAEMQHYLDAVVIDTANGDKSYAIKTYEMIRELFPSLDIIAGNISVGKSAKMWAEMGADALRVGQGGGSICTTRIVTGIGNPQVSAIYECAREAEKHGIPIIADGGVTKLGDIPVAIAAGAHTVMMGKMLAGTDESPGKVWTRKDGMKVKTHRGMGSPDAMVDHPERYRIDPNTAPLPEGVTGEVPYEGSIVPLVGNMVKALRKGLDYCGRRTLQDHRDNTMLGYGTSSAQREASPHDITIVG